MMHHHEEHPMPEPEPVETKAFEVVLLILATLTGLAYGIEWLVSTLS